MHELGRSFLAVTERWPDAPAIIDGGEALTYQDWYARIDRLAGGLRALGLQRGERVVSVLQNNLQAATLHWACQLAGVVIVPLNWRMKPEEVDYCVGDCEARAIVYEGVSAEAVAQAPACAGIARIAVGDAAGGTHSFADLVAGGVAGNAPAASGDDYSVFLYTSGTTGRPKGVPRRHSAERASAVAHVAQNLYEPGERTLGVMPLYHTMGVRSLLSMALVNGLFVAQPKFSAAGSLELIERHRVTCLYLVPTLYHELLAVPGFSRERVQSCGKLGFAGAPMTAGLLKRVRENFPPCRLVNHYGSSEIYTFTVDPDGFRKPGSAGKSGINQRIRVVAFGSRDPEARAAVGAEGEIVADLASAEAFSGYWKRPDADEKSLIDGWYFTGDTGYVDADGDLFITGRVDDMIITGGENVTPVEVESVLSLHDKVAEVVVAGLPDERWGQKICAFVRRAGAVDAAELDAFCRQSDLANFKRPREYIFVREVPKSPTGKILRRVLVAGDYKKDA